MRQMEIATDYAVKLFFSSTSFIQVFFEAVANSLDAGASDISIIISPESSKSLSDDLEITITDNGKGLTDDRFERFKKIKPPKDRYHKGLGRLVYLNYFSSVDIVSVYQSKKRQFEFNNSFTGVVPEVNASSTDREGTVLRFRGFVRDRLRSMDDLKPSYLKDRLLEQFLPLFHDRKKANKAFKIELHLETPSGKQKEFLRDTQTITMDDVPVLECKQFLDKTLDAFSQISMYYMVKNGTRERQPLIAACIDGRTISLNKLLNATAIPENCSVIFLFESELFNGNSDSTRQRLILPENITEAMLYRALRPEMSAVLNDSLPEIKEKNTKTREHFETRYPHLTGLFEENSVGLIDREEAISTAQTYFFRQQKEILECETLDDKTFEKTLEVSSRTLTEYILYRELIIKKFSTITESSVEEYGHDLLVPRYARFEKSKMLDNIYSNNAWLLDDKFMTFQTILSEKRMDELIRLITGNDDVRDGGRPDISMVFSADPEAGEAVDVVVVELKRKKEDEEKSAYVNNQLLARARKLVDHCANIQRMWYFGIVEMDPQLNQFLDDDGWSPLFSRGTVWFKERPLRRESKPPVPVPTYILSYDSLIKDAAARNHTFLNLLKNSFKRSALS